VAWLGGFSNQVHTIEQSIPLGRGGKPLYLVFYYQARSNETGCGEDRAAVRVNETVVWTYPLCQSQNTVAWQRASVNLGDYTGKRVMLRFRGEFDEAVVSSFFVEDVRFSAAP
jgi:hypothetical protein